MTHILLVLLHDPLWVAHFLPGGYIPYQPGKNAQRGNYTSILSMCNPWKCDTYSTLSLSLSPTPAYFLRGNNAYIHHTYQSHLHNTLNSVGDCYISLSSVWTLVGYPRWSRSSRWDHSQTTIHSLCNMLLYNITQLKWPGQTVTYCTLHSTVHNSTSDVYKAQSGLPSLHNPLQHLH